VYDAKRLIGRKFNDPEVQADIKNWPFTVREGDGGKPVIIIKHGEVEKEYKPEEISAIILDKLRTIAETFTGLKVSSAVITVPAYFNNN